MKIYCNMHGLIRCFHSVRIQCLYGAATVLCAGILSAVAPAQGTEAWLRTPALNPDGTQIAFSYQGDIWTAALEGGPAKRLTIHESYEYAPSWDAGGENLVFLSNRQGNDDIYEVAASGSRPERLTYFSGSEDHPRYGRDGDLYFSSRRTFAAVERESEIHLLASGQATPRRFMDALGSMAVPSPDGRFIAFVRGSCRIEREAYTGPASRDIWLYNIEKGSYSQLTDFEGQDIYPDWGPEGELYYLSAANGKYNLYRLTVDEAGNAASAPEALTRFTDLGIRFFDVSAEGQVAVIERGITLYRLDTQPGAEPVPLRYELSEDYRFDPVEQETFSRSATEYALSPNEKNLAFVVRGEIFVKRNDGDNSRAVRLTRHAWRDQAIDWLNDSTLIFTSDRTGNKELFLLRSADSEVPDLYKTLKWETVQLTETEADEQGFVLSPDKKQLVFLRGRGQMILADIDAAGAMSNQRTLLDGWATPGSVAWSPDSRWLAYHLSDLNFNSEIYIHPLEGEGKPVNVSMHPRGDVQPVWSPDGSKLGFLSIRNNGDADVWFAWLKKADWEKTQRDWEDLEDEAENGEKEEKEKKDSPPLVEIDLEGIHERLVQVTRMPGSEENLLISKDGETFFFTTNGGSRQGSEGDPALMKISWNGEDAKTLASNAPISQLRWDKKGSNFYYLRQGGTLGKSNEDGKMTSQSFQARMVLDHPEERRQIFNEAWRTLDAGFYDPKFHGQDWQALRARYEPWALQASTAQDFRTMFNEMLGQLNASHMGLYGSTPEETQNDRTGLLGIEVVPRDRGVAITYVLPNGPADRSESQLREGEILLSVNGQRIDPSVNVYALLNGLANERVLLEVSGPGGLRELVIRPASSLSSERYEAWVAERQALTEAYSGGRLGYIHIQGMNWPSFERFERELMASGYGKEGIVIDVRFNGGGWTTDMLMAVLNVRQHAYTVPRGAADDLEKSHTQFTQHYPFGERLPLSAWTQPSIALCNQNSYSNAEIFSHAYKTLGIGTLVGTPTFGAVISTGGQGLIDGSFVRLPFRAWYVKATEENMEHGPAVPDVIIDNAPGSRAKGEDAQLKKAVELLLDQIDGR